MTAARGWLIWIVAVTLLMLGRAAPAAAQEWHPHLLHYSIAASMVAHSADVATSMYALGRDPQRYREANPILRPFADQPAAFGVVKMSMAVGVNYALLKMHAQHPRLALVASIAQTVAVGYVAHRNARLR
jgi:hypothetical protein